MRFDQIRLKVYDLTDDLHEALPKANYEQAEYLRSRILDLQELSFALKKWQEDQD